MSGEQDVALEWQIGDVILGLYEVRDVVRSGGMGLVYRVLHRGWNVELAVKSPRRELVSSPTGARHFEAEAEAWVGLGLHPNTVSCVYVRRLGGLPRVFAEWVDGGTLADAVSERRLYEGGPQAALLRILDVSIQFAWGLEHAHQNRLIHQDVKPANVMVSVDGTVKVTDFGLAKARATAGESTVVPPGGSVLAGYGGMTPAYCSPEQALAAEGRSEALTRATDVWSWALSVLEMFMGRPPTRHGQAGMEVLAALVETGSPDPQVPSLPGALAELLGWCLEPDPSRRPRDMGELADALIDIHDRMAGAPYPRARPEAAGLLADGLSNQALSMLDLGHLDRAQTLWQQALDADHSHLHTTYNRGLDQWRRARITDQQLVAALETLHAAEPDWRAAYLLGRVHLERGDLAAALELLGEAARMSPGDTEVQGAIGLADFHASQTRYAARLEHAGIVTAVALAGDGRMALTGCADGSMRLWEVRSGLVLCELAAHDGYLCSIALIADGRRAVAGFRNGLVQVRDLSSERHVRTLQPGDDDHDDDYQLAASADGRIVVSVSPTSITAWELPAGRRTHSFSTGDRSVRSVAVSPDCDPPRWMRTAATPCREIAG